MNLVDTDTYYDNIILIDSVPAPVKTMWTTLKDRIAYVRQQNKLNNVYINNYQNRDDNYETINYVNYVWQELMIYNLSNEIMTGFKIKLQNLYQLVRK